ncbi:hypothetical protein RI844_11155 [Thalassotalea fonticola]|uniref:Outer membrane protein beta-barrel domain-containing protein n=1 Tax=Thalassotalea fonticola TaxID=3065649 RepID=A0ABZ0GJI2_9GAMM|nr:hypothetical protein RI844_11155 [Colwelliaceae bacterium S1-1]
MKSKYAISIISTTLFLLICSSSSLAANEAFVGLGMGNQDQDGANSVNLSFTTGYDFYQRDFQSSRFQGLTIGVEAQYSPSISGNNETTNYSLFGAAKIYTSEQYYLKLKQGVTRFPDAVLTDSDAERSHIGLGVGLGYKLDNGAFEIEYVYSNKTLHAAVFEISYKYQF